MTYSERKRETKQRYMKDLKPKLIGRLVDLFLFQRASRTLLKYEFCKNKKLFFWLSLKSNYFLSCGLDHLEEKLDPNWTKREIKHISPVDLRQTQIKHFSIKNSKTHFEESKRKSLGKPRSH